METSSSSVICRDLVFLGRGVDTQTVLCQRNRGRNSGLKSGADFLDLMPGGGFVFNAVHNIQADVAPENIWRCGMPLQEFGNYSLIR